MRVYFVIITAFVRLHRGFWVRLNHFSLCSSPAGYPGPSLTSPLEMKSGFSTAQMLFDSPQDILSDITPEQQQPPQVPGN